METHRVNKLFVKTILVIVFFTGLLAFVEWQTGFSPLKSLHSHHTPMRLITAGLLLMSVVALWLEHAGSSYKVAVLRIVGVVVIYVSIMSLVTYQDRSDSVQKDYFIFNFFLSDDTRMALFTSLIFLCLGIIFVLLSYTSNTYDDLAHVLFFPVFSLSYFVLISYLLKITEVLSIQGIYTAPETAFSLLLLSIAVLFIKPGTWLMKIILGRGPGSLMGIRLLPWILLLPVVISWARIKADQHNIFSDEIGAVLVGLTYTISFILLIWWSAYNVNMIDEKRQQAYRTLQKSQELLQIKEKEEAMLEAAKNATLKLNEELMRSNKELEQFAYLTSHDLQEPLRTITTYTEWLAQKLQGSYDKESEKIMQGIIRSSLRMKDLINDLLTYSIIGSGTSQFTQVDFNGVFSKVVKEHENKIRLSNATVTSTALPVVNGDETQLCQLLFHLIDNSLKFSAVKPEIHVSCKEEPEHWLFSVSDNGIGINMKYSDKIFLIFQRLVNRHEYPGTGIGLAISKRIVERHGGSISFTSVPNEGTTFTFSIAK